MTTEPRPTGREHLSGLTPSERLRKHLELNGDILTGLAEEQGPLTLSDTLLAQLDHRHDMRRLKAVEELVGWPDEGSAPVDNSSLWIASDLDMAVIIEEGANLSTDKLNNFFHLAHVPGWTGLPEDLPDESFITERAHMLAPYRMRFGALFPELEAAIVDALRETRLVFRKREIVIEDYFDTPRHEKQLTLVEALRIAHCLQQRLMRTDDRAIQASLMNLTVHPGNEITDSAAELYA